MRHRINLYPNSANTFLTMKKICITFLILATIAVITAPAYAANFFSEAYPENQKTSAKYSATNVTSGTYIVKITPTDSKKTYDFLYDENYSDRCLPLNEWERCRKGYLYSGIVDGKNYSLFVDMEGKPIYILKTAEWPDIDKYDIIGSYFDGPKINNYVMPKNPPAALLGEYQDSNTKLGPPSPEEQKKLDDFQKINEDSPFTGSKEDDETASGISDGIGNSADPTVNLHKEATATNGDLNVSQDCTVNGGLIGWALHNCDIPAEKDQVYNFIVNATQFLLSIAAIVAVIMIIINAYKLMASMGNEEMAASGKSGLTATTTGLIIIMLAKFILQIVTWVLGGG